jgi:glycosyltransferase involved in cell wall biosynthesis
MSTPAVSVLVPTYNGERYLAACLDSVLAQTQSDWELIVVDDCSSDGTLDIARAYARRDARVRVARNRTNLGMVRNWNHCVDLARGTWVKFLFQDDLMVPSCIAEMVAAAREATDFVACKRGFIFEDGTSATDREFYLTHPSVTSLDGMAEVSPAVVCDWAIDRLGVNFIGEPSAVLLRRDLFARFGGFDPDLIMICDTEYWVRVASHTGLIHVPQTLCQFRVHPGSASARALASRRYRISLDVVLLLWGYTFGDTYAKLREVATSRTPPVDFRDWLMAKVEKASSLAASGGEDGGESVSKAEWDGFLQQHPKIGETLAKEHPPNGNLLHRLTGALGRAAHRMGR